MAKKPYSWFRVYDSEYPDQIGKWIVSLENVGAEFYDFFQRSTARAVVDDFGNLVRVH